MLVIVQSPGLFSAHYNGSLSAIPIYNRKYCCLLWPLETPINIVPGTVEAVDQYEMQ